MAITTITLTQTLLPLVAASLPFPMTSDKEAPSRELTTGASILDRFIDVIGGKAAFDKLHNRVHYDRVVHVGMGFEDKAVVYTARPNKRFVNIESEALGNIQNGTDGNVVWYLPPEGGPMIEEGSARDAQLAEAAFDRIDNWQAYYDKAEFVKETAVEDKECYEVLATPKVGPAETHSYDKETGLLVKVRRTRLSSCMPAMVVELMFDDYRVVDGVRLPYKIHQKVDQCGSPREMMFIIERIEHNVALSSDRFTPPSSVLAAAAAKKIGGLVKDLTGVPEDAPRAPCGSGAASAKEPQDR